MVYCENTKSFFLKQLSTTLVSAVLAADTGEYSPRTFSTQEGLIY